MVTEVGQVSRQRREGEKKKRGLETEDTQMGGNRVYTVSRHETLQSQILRSVYFLHSVSFCHVMNKRILFVIISQLISRL